MKSLLLTQAKTPTTHLVDTRTELLLLLLYTSNILASHQISHLKWGALGQSSETKIKNTIENMNVGWFALCGEEASCYSTKQGACVYADGKKEG